MSIRVIALALFACLLFGQEFRSTLTGRVTDPTGSVVAGAKVSATETNTNSRFDSVTTSDGQYTFPLLLPGVYTLTAEVSGFKTYSQAGITIASNARVAQNITLALGSASEVVSVHADASQLETVRDSTGQSITSRELENLPLDGHTALDAEFLGFGVISQGNRDANSPSGNAGFAAISMGGAASGANEILIDGVPDIGTQGTTGRRPAFLPPPDAVVEVKVQAFQADAAAGGAGGGTVEMITKGGTNAFHGSAYEYNNSPALQATPFFVNAIGGAKASTETNQWGGTVGGPIWIPKVYNGKNRLFFFFAYEGIHSGGPTPVYTTVPTAAERMGDFSALLALNNGSKNYTLYDPATAVLSNGVITRQPFANNIIPQSRLNPTAVSFLNQFVPLPNRTGVYDDTNNYATNETVNNPYNFFSGRGDLNVSDRNKLTFAGRRSQYLQYGGDPFQNVAYQNHGLGRAAWGGEIDDVHTFSPTLVGDLRVGFTRYIAYYYQPGYGYDATQLGFPAYINTNSTHPLVPQFTFSDGYTGNGNNGGQYSNQPSNTYQVFNSYTKVKGDHTLKFGGEVRLQDFSNVSWSGSSGAYTFDTGTWVKQTSNATAPTLGGSLAEFLLGLPTSGSYSINSPTKADAYYSALFVQDDWHARPNLTVNVGLRWEKTTPTTESHNRQVIGFDPTLVNATTQTAAAAYANKPIAQIAPSGFTTTGGLIFADANHRTAYSTTDLGFAPRVGISWTPGVLHNRTVIRSGFGIFYYNLGTVTPQSPGFSSTSTYVATNDSYLTPATTLSNPFPNGITQPSGSSLGVNTYLGQSVSFYNPNYQNQYSLRWNFDIQQQIGQNMLFEVAYVGNHSVHLTTSYNFDALPSQYLSTTGVRNAATIAALGAVVTNPYVGLLPGTSSNGSTTATSNLLRPYPEYTGVTELNMNNGDSYFNQLAVSFQKRLSKGMQFFVNYQHSRLMDHTNYLNAGSLALEKRVANDDRPDYLVVSALFDIPVGRGRRYLTNGRRVVDWTLGGWQLGVIGTYYEGAPLTFGDLIYNGQPLNYNAHNENGPAFNTAAFNTISSQQLASDYRTFPSHFNNLRLDSMKNVNLNLTKSFRIHENIRLQFRGEAYNLCNRPLFEAPILTPTASNFGYITTQTNSPRGIQLALRLTF